MAELARIAEVPAAVASQEVTMFQPARPLLM